MFGSSTANTGGGFSFGSGTTNTGTTGSTGFSFGNSGTTGTTGSTGFSFGTNNNANKSNSLFGNSGTTGTTGSTGFSFGGSNNNTTGSSGFSFGGNNNTNTTGSSGFSFGSSNNTNTGSSLFGNNNNNTNNNAGFVFAGGSTGTGGNDNGGAVAAVMKIANAYDPGSKECRFESVIYNRVPSLSIHNFVKPPCRPELWERAVRENPDPSNLVPVVVRSFSDLKKRVLLYQRGRNSCLFASKELKNKLLEAKQEQETKRKTFAEIRKRQLTQSHRFLKILRKLATTQGRNAPLFPEEVDLHRRLIAFIPEQQDAEQVHARVEETVATLPPQRKTFPTPDAENMKKLFSFLREHQANIQRLMKTIEEEKKDLQVMEKTISTK